MTFDIESPARLGLPGELILAAVRIYRGVAWRAEFHDAGAHMRGTLSRNGAPIEYSAAPSHARAFANEANKAAELARYA